MNFLLIDIFLLELYKTKQNLTFTQSSPFIYIYNGLSKPKKIDYIIFTIHYFHHTLFSPYITFNTSTILPWSLRLIQDVQRSRGRREGGRRGRVKEKNNWASLEESCVLTQLFVRSIVFLPSSSEALKAIDTRPLGAYMRDVGVDNETKA